jgi:hypothetical protein
VVLGAPVTSNAAPLPITHVRTIQRMSRLVDTMLSAADNDMIRRFESEICRLPAKAYGTLEFDMPEPRLQLFLQAARNAMTAHLDSRKVLASAGV